MEPDIVYLSRGRLFLKQPGRETREIESDFARRALDQQARSRAIDGWKSNAAAWNTVPIGVPDLADWEATQSRQPIRFQSVSRGSQAGELLYALDMGNVGGLFHYDLGTAGERRLMHREGFRVQDVARHPTDDYIAIASPGEGGTTSLIIAENEGRRHNRIAGGDSHDEAPSWVQGGGRKLVYQSADVGRNQAGIPLGAGPYKIEMLDIDREKINVVAESEAHDLLSPKMLADQTLLFIRRPYKPTGYHKVDLKSVVLDVILFPYRVLRAMFYFMNFVSVMFSGRPLATSGSLQRHVDDSRFLRLWGRMIDTKRALEKADDSGTASLVPKDWELVRRGPDGAESVIAYSVLAFDVNSDGEILFTNGSRIVHIDGEGKQSQLAIDSMIQSVMFVA